MTTAVRNTVVEYTKPTPSLKRPFSESHIARKIRQQNLATVPESEERKDSLTSDVDTVDRAPSPFPLTDQDLSSGGLGIDGVDSSISTKVNSANSDGGASPEPLGPIFQDVETIDAEVLDAHMFTANLPPLELLVRTSGVERLSDFMLWQCHQDTSIVFLDCLWPEFNLWKFIPVLVEWQWRKRKGDESAKGLRKRMKVL
jgi:ditrans,polycis-polyprenyl diphosphate synthase